MIEGYNVLVWFHRNRHGGGVLIFVKENVKCEPITVETSNNIESVWINVKFNQESLVAGTMYWPPSVSQEYYNGTLEQLDFVSVNHDKVVLMGDLNFNYKIAESLQNV